MTLYYKRTIDKAFTALLINKNQRKEVGPSMSRLRQSAKAKQMSPSALAAEPIVPVDNSNNEFYDIMMDKENSSQ